MAVSSARGYMQVQKQSAFGTPAAMDSNRRAFAYRNTPRGGGEVTNTRYRESSSGFDIGLSLKEGIKYMAEFPILARPTTLAWLACAAFGPRSDQGKLGGGARSNGLARPPKLAAGGGNKVLGALVKPADTTLTISAADGNFGTGDKIVVGWGPNMEFFKIHASTPPSGTTITLDPTTLPKFPHAVNEPVYEVNGYTTVATDYTTGVTLTVVDQTGFPSAATLAVGPQYAAGKEGSEYGQMEELAYSAKVSTTGFTIAGLVHEHSVGCWVWEPDLAITTSSIHGMEPVSRLGSKVDFFTTERAISSLLVERMSDGPCSAFELAGEAPGPLTLQTGFKPRLGQMQSGVLAEDYTNQGASDIPFRMPNGKYVIGFNSNVVSSDQIRQFAFNMTNTIIDNIFTDDIVPNDMLHVARESNLASQFYFKDSTDYREFIYGGQSNAVNPSAVAASGYFLASFLIDTTKRLTLFVPNITWEAYPVNPDAEPKAIVVEAQGAPLKLANRPMVLMGIQNADVAVYA